MKFSIVITTYNRVDFLRRAIASALAQTMPCEVVVVDDASTDGTEDYVRSLGNQVVYHRNAQNLKHSGSVNAGVERATGDWIKFLDDDDYLDPTCIEKMAAAIARHPEAVLCSCRVIQVDEHEQTLRYRGAIGPSDVFYIPQTAVHYGMLLEQIPVGTPVQVAAQRQAFLAAGGWNPEITTNYDDIDAWIRIADYGDVLFLQDFLAYRTIWSEGIDQKTGIAYHAHFNVDIKARIHQRVNAAYQPQCPSLKAISQYVYLHWGVVAFKQGDIATALTLTFPIVFLPQIWWLLLKIRWARQGYIKALVTKLPVVDVPASDATSPDGDASPSRRSNSISLDSLR